MQGSGLLGMVTGALGGLFGAFAGLFMGIWGAWYGYKTNLKSARSPRERTFHQRYGLFWLIVFALYATPVLVAVTVYSDIQQSPRALAFVIAVGTLLLIPTMMASTAYSRRRIEAIRIEDGTIDQPVDVTGFPNWVRRLQIPRVYESKARLLGIPLVSIQFSGQLTAKNVFRPAFGWIAFGDVAYGILFAFGGITVGGIAIGGGSIGLISLGGMAVGVVSMGGTGVGVWALGGAAFGWLAFGGLAVGWKAAVGGVAVAREFAVGGVTLARHADDEVAKAFVEGSGFFGLGEVVFTPWTPWIMMVVVFLFIYVLQRVGPKDVVEEN